MVGDCHDDFKKEPQLTLHQQIKRNPQIRHILTNVRNGPRRPGQIPYDMDLVGDIWRNSYNSNERNFLVLEMRLPPWGKITKF